MRPVVGETFEGLVRKLRIVVVAACIHDLETGSQALLVGDGVESLNTHQAVNRPGTELTTQLSLRGGACAAGLCRGTPGLWITVTAALAPETS